MAQRQQSPPPSPPSPHHPASRLPRGIPGLLWCAVLLLGWLHATHLGCEAPSNEPTPDATSQEPGSDRPDASTSEPGPEPSAEPSIETAPLRDYGQDDSLRLNHIQTKGTHNSYHLDPGQGVGEWRYSHKPLDVQLGDQGVRQFELDVQWNQEKQTFLVYHIGLVDQKTTCETYIDCLKVIKAWSDVHRQHLPIFIFIEPKGIAQIPAKDAFDALEKESLSVFPKERILQPDDIKGSHASLKDAVAKDGWPTLGQVRGKVAFVLLMGGEYRTTYTSGDKHLDGRVMFVTADVGSPYAAVVKLDDPVKDEARIKEALQMGIIVRTRADAGLEIDKKRLEAALRGGAHFLSTDYPAPVDGVDYVVTIPGGQVARCNPITAPPSCKDTDLE